MLGGFFRLPDNTRCLCRVVDFWDRVWVQDTGDAEYFRSCTVEVDQNSPCPLTGVNLLMPVAPDAVQDIRDRSGTAFDENFYFNSCQCRSTYAYRIVQDPAPEGRCLAGKIDDDGIDDITVFTGAPRYAPALTVVEQCAVIRVTPPRGVCAGERWQFRLSFRVPGLALNMGTPSLPHYSVKLLYFYGRNHPNEMALLGGDERLIRAVPQLAGSSAGGVSVVAYSPPGFTHESGFDGMRQLSTTYGPDGVAAEARTEWVWNLAQALRDQGMDPSRPFGLETEFILSGSMTRPGALGSHVDRMSGELREHGSQLVRQAGQLAKHGRLSWWALVIAILGLALAAIPLLWRLFSSGRSLKP